MFVMKQNSRSKGVTLIELSIVLAILGILIIVGISGRSLIDVSRATSTIKQIGDRDLAFQIFTSTYDCVPGDCAITTVVGANGALNTVGIGNGNTLIEAATATTPNEIAFAEEHLVKAQLFNRTYSTITAFTGAQNAGENLLAQILPAVKIPSSYISSITVGNLGNYNVVGGASATENIFNNQLVLYPAILRIVDSKIDDGSAFTGRVRCETAQPASTIATFANVGTDYSAITSCVLFSSMSI